MCQMCTGRHRSHNVRPTPVQPDPKGKFLGNERRPGADQKLFSTSRFFRPWPKIFEGFEDTLVCMRY